MQFKDVIGQGAIKKRLIESVKENRVSHALLFSGKQGSGKLPMAIAYAQFLNCTNKQENDSCGECHSCKKFQKLVHPDLHFVFPIFKKEKDSVCDHFIAPWREHVLRNPYFNINSWNKALNIENAQAMIYVNESSEIIRKLSLKTFEAEYKVMIIWMIERMNNECANKLLKIFEEPPPKTLFIMISERDELLLSTIKSRTQLVKFTGIDQESMINALSVLPESEGKNLKGLAHLSNGNYIYALELLSPEEEAKFNFDEFSKMMRMSYKKAWEDIFAWADSMASTGREKQKEFLLYSMRMIRENFVMNFKQPDIVYLSRAEKSFCDNFSPYINERNIMEFSAEFERAFRDISSNGNPKIIFCDLILRVVKLIRA